MEPVILLVRTIDILYEKGNTQFVHIKAAGAKPLKIWVVYVPYLENLNIIYCIYDGNHPDQEAHAKYALPVCSIEVPEK